MHVGDTRGHFDRDAGAFTGRDDLRLFMRDALRGYERTREATTARFADHALGRHIASAIKWEAIEGLDRHLDEFARRLEARGAKVCWASSAAEARDYIVGLARDRGARRIVKSKCMTTEEIELNAALEAAGCEVTESDLGEYIVQIRGEGPFHFVFPAMHLKRGEISADFVRHLGTEPTDSPEELTMIARRTLREKFLAADMGITGANFGVAETGMVSVTENEGNARLTLALPRIHVVVMGIEKILPRLEDLALFLPLLATAGTGQLITCYNSLVGGPRQPGESDGPEEMHVVLLDNGRTRLLADPEARDALRCIRCGACLNACPVYKNIGGHAYGTPYQGPIGSVIMPRLRALEEWQHLSFASSLCGACTETCPLGIDLHHQLLRNRHLAAQAAGSSAWRLAFRAFAFVARRPLLYRFAVAAARPLLRIFGRGGFGSVNPLRAWTATRDLPPAPTATFRSYWEKRHPES